tara:strand:- start:2490 stop:3677 length:1188 start_codon:yes stop_codon:yes gene_type:complete
MEKKTNLKFPFFLFSSSHNIEIQSIAYSLNLFLPTLFLIITSFFRDYNLTAELGILIGVNIIFTQIFSANARSIIISKKLISSIYNYIIFRIIISIVLICANLFFFSIFEFSNKHLLLAVSFLIIFQWLNELILTFFELKKKVNEFYFYISICLIFIFFIIVDFLYYQNLTYVFLINNILLLLFFFNFFLKIKKIKKKKIHLRKFFILSIINKAFYSSFSISFANLIWRLLIIQFCGKILAGIYFASFALGSLPGTLFNNTFGPTIIKNNIKVNKSLYFLKYIFITTIIVLFFWSILNRDQMFINLSYTQIFGTFLSLLGSYFMIKGQYARQYLIQKTQHQSFVFKIDVLYSLIIMVVVPILYVLGGDKLIIISFLVSSIIAHAVYNFTYNKFLK